MSPIIPKVNGLVIKSAGLISLETEVLCLSTHHVTLSNSSEYFFNVTPKFDFLKAINLILSFVWIYTSCYFGFYKPNFNHLKSYLTIQLNNYQNLLVVLLAYFY